MYLTNLLLTILIGLIGAIGKIFYDKMEKIDRDLRQALIDNSSMRETINDHDRRLNRLENKMYEEE